MRKYTSKVGPFKRKIYGAPLLVIFGILFLGVGLKTSWAAAAIDSAALNPASAPVGVATTVTVTAVIADPAVIADGVNLQRVDTAGRVVAVLGNLRDDGANGDAAANDKTFTIRLTTFETVPGPITLRVSAAFLGRLTRVFSSPLTVNVTGATPTGINILSPANLAFINTNQINVSGAVGDPGAVVTVNGINAPVSGKNFLVLVPLLEGNNTLTAVARNTGGTTSTATIQVTLDTTPPRITVEAPANNLVTTDASITVSGTVNDVVVGTVNDQQAQVTVNGVAAQVANRGFLAANVPLSLGLNTIQVVGRDRTGNSATAIVQVRRETPTRPFIRVVSGSNQSGPISSLLPAPLIVALDDGRGNPVKDTTVVFNVTDNNGSLISGGAGSSALAVTTDPQGRAQVSFRLGTRSGAGSNRVEATATGFQGTVVFMATGLPTGAAKINVDTGNTQTGALKEKLAFPFVAIVTDAGHNRIAGVPVTFTVKQGGGNINGQPSATMNTDPDGRALAVLTLGTEPGFDNNLVEATFPGNPGLPVSFVASAKAPGNAADTRITGAVLDNSDNPIAGVTVRLFLTHHGSNNNTPQQIGTPVQTDAQGQFLIHPAPVGYFKLMADGTTVPSSRGTFPTLEYDLVTVAGQNNTVGMPLYLPQLDTVNKLCVNETTGGTLTLPEVPGFSLTVAPGSATFPGGSRTGCVTVSMVNPDKVPMSPGFGQQPRFIVTIQPVGTIFNPPAPITMPNVDGLGPGQVTEFYSYDHDLSAFTAIGTGTVSADGMVVRSDPGVGIIKAGWHCGGNPNQQGTGELLAIKSISPSTDQIVGIGEQLSFTATANAPGIKWEIKGGAFTIVSETANGNSSTIIIKFEEAKEYTVKAICEKGSPVSKSVKVTAVKVDIKQGGTTITDTTHDEIVGKKISLSGEVQPSGLTITKKQWTVPGERISNFTGSTTTGTVTQLTDLNNSTIDFYWVDGGDGRDVVYTVTIKGKTFDAKATFDVKRPTAKIIATTGTVAVDSAWGRLELHYGSPATPGISFSRTITVPSGFSGTTQWVQLVQNTLRRGNLNDGTWQKFTGSGVLDTKYPYDSASSTIDSPGISLTSSYLKMSANDDYEMLLMFKPSTAGSIWVPLRKVDWSWSGVSSRSGTTWTLDSSTNTANPLDGDSTTHPTWTSNVTSLTWANE